MTAGEGVNNRVTQRQIYDTLREIEQRITDKLEPLAAVCNQVENNKESIKELEKDVKDISKRSNVWDSVNSFAAVIGGVIGTITK